MPTLDDVSRSIGALQAEVANASRSRELTHQKLEAISRQMEEFSQMLAGLSKDVSDMAPEVKHYADARRRVAGGLAVVMLGAGLIGAVVVDVLKHFLFRA